MIEDLSFSEPWLLWLIPVMIISGLVSLRWCRNKLLILSRVAIFCLLLIALANPYVVVTQTTQTKKPLITVVSDQTDSMDIFDQGTTQRVREKLPDSQLRMFSGSSTPLGDKILQYAQQGGTLVLVSDGYSNRGRDLKEALALTRSSNATVFAIEMEPLARDASVEISGTNTAVLGGDYPFTMILRWSGEEFSGTLTVYADNRRIYQDYLSVDGRSTSIKMNHKFQSTGAHVLRATISPQEDRQTENNEYLKAIYVVPKPDVLLVTEDASSPLASVLSDHYKVTTASEFRPGNKKYKAVVLDNQKYRSELNPLKEYVSKGGGLVVVGGPESYEFGNYHNTILETVLPVKSVPSIFEGGKIVILIMDISGSTRRDMSVGGTTFLEYEKSLAIELLKSPEFQDDRVGMAVFGTEAFVVFNPMPIAGKQFMIEERISSLSPKTGTQEDTQLDSGLKLAWNMLNSTGREGELIVISDGRVKEYQESFDKSVNIIKSINVTTHLIEVKSFEEAPGGFRDLADKTGANYHSAVYPGSVTIRTGEWAEEQEPPEEETPQTSEYGLMILNPNHYITSDLGLMANLTGFNDVTPRPGSQKLVAMPDGKPVLTTWRYGLGRVASLTTDDGMIWASEIYSAQNSKLVSRTVNWAVGDPRPESGRIDAGDGWLGTPLKITIVSQSPPQIRSAQVEKIGEDRYQVTFTPKKIGMHQIKISDCDYGIAINYPLEFRDVGFNSEFPRLIMANGGKMFAESEIRGRLIEEARKKNEITVQQRVSKRGFLLFTTLAIFLAEIILRRRKEVRR
ncbi:MAG: vWA domain-containing protein [Methanotrichaceae archaeon]